MSTNVREFELQIRRFEDELPEQHRKRVQEIALDAISSITEKTPVDTGFAWMNWNLSLDRPDFSTGESRADPLSRAGPELKRLKPFQDVYIANGAEYIGELEDGHSKQAPYGMVATTLARIRSKYGL